MILNNTIAIIPSRLNSKRLPKKNIYNINNKPIISWVVRKALKSQIFQKVIVSSESLDVKNIITKEGAEFHKRSKKLSSDKATVIQVCKDVLKNLKSKNLNFCCIYPTALLLTINDLRKSFKKFKKSNCSSLISVTDYNLPPFQALFKKNKYWHLYFKEYEKLQSNNYPDIFCDAGMFYWSDSKYIFQNNSFYSNKMEIFHIPFDRVCDLNTPNDLKLLKRNIKFIDNKKKIYV